MHTPVGNCSKDSQYLNRIKKAIEEEKGHPRHHGVLMQAHHLISGEGMKRSGLGHQIEKFGYDINLLPNLVFIPCTLQGACYLSVQPHRGNHTADVDQDDYADDSEPMNYHKMISFRLKDLNLPISKECPGDHKTKVEKVIGELDELSKKILKLIQNKPNEAPLTNIARYFTYGNSIGCGGVDYVGMNKGLTSCTVERNHHNKQALGQKSEGITYINNGKFNLKVGK
ncbi:hypothetical protein AAKU55_000547 [Oxalobacteraceae bacterium GrIS 1.11]